MEMFRYITICLSLSVSAYSMDVYRVINPVPPPVNHQQQQSNNYGNHQNQQQRVKNYHNPQGQQLQGGNNQNQQQSGQFIRNKNPLQNEFSNNPNKKHTLSPQQVEGANNYKHNTQSLAQRVSNNFDRQQQIPANTATIKNQLVPPPQKHLSGGNGQQPIVEGKYIQLQQGGDGSYVPQSQVVKTNSQQEPAPISALSNDNMQDKPSINIYIQRAAPADTFIQQQQANDNLNVQPVNEQFMQPHGQTNEKYVPHQQSINNKFVQEQPQPANNNYVAGQQQQQQPVNNNYVAGQQQQPVNNNYVAGQQQPVNNNYIQEQSQPVINDNFVQEQTLNSNYVQDQQPSPINNNYVQEPHRTITDTFRKNDQTNPLVEDTFMPQKDQPLLEDNFIQRKHEPVKDHFVKQTHDIPVASNNFANQKPQQPLISRNAEVQNPLPPPMNNNNYPDPINKGYVDQLQNQHIPDNTFLQQKHEILPGEEKYGFEESDSGYAQKQSDKKLQDQPPSDGIKEKYIHEEPNLPTPKPIGSPVPHRNRPIDMYHTPTESLACENPLDDGSPYYDDDMDCNCYYVCSKQRNAIKMCCPSGLWWDQRDKKCLFGREFPLRKQALCLQLARRKALAQARSRAKEILMEAEKSGEDSKVQNDDNEHSKKSDIDLTIDRYYSHLPQEYIYGHCSVQPNPAFDELKDFIWGSVDLRQSLKGGHTELRINVTGLNANDNNRLHGFHIHEYGDLSRGCESAGGHYDPFGVVHGGPRDSPQFRHFGDLGNIEEDSHGNIEVDIKDYLVSLLGPFSVLGRAIVIHEGEDDLGRGNSEDSLLTGSAGARLACCTIGLSDGSRWP